MPDNMSPTPPPTPAPSPDQVRADLSSAADTLAETAGEVAEAAKGEASELKDAATAQLNEAAARAKGFATQHKDVAAGQIEGLSSALTKAADELATDENTVAVAQYARQAANRVEQFADTMRQNSVDDLLSMAQDFGRRQPVAFLAAAALAGFGAGRFIMASAQRPAPSAPTATSFDPDESNAYGSTARADGDVPDSSELANSNAGGAFK